LKEEKEEENIPIGLHVKNFDSSLVLLRGVKVHDDPIGIGAPWDYTFSLPNVVHGGGLHGGGLHGSLVSAEPAIFLYGSPQRQQQGTPPFLVSKKHTHQTTTRRRAFIGRRMMMIIPTASPIASNRLLSDGFRF
jgi:hypothetical protein